MTIKVFPSLLPGEPLEKHECAGCTIGQWLNHKGIAYQGLPYQPIQISANGRVIKVDEWMGYEVDEDDEVEIRILPQGGVFSAIGSIIGAVFDFAFGWLMPGTPDVATNQTAQGRELEPTNATANIAKLGGIVPETAGTFRRFPEYLTPPRRYWAGPRDQRLEFLCCAGPGRYQILADDIKVGDTSIEAMGDDAKCLIFEPGDDLSAVPQHQHWYSVEEVGGTSSGTAGLELSSIFSSEVDPTATQFNVNNRTITIDPGEGKFPDGWGADTVVDVRVPQTYSVTVQDGETVRNRFTGNFREVAPSVGLALSAVGILPTASYVVTGASVDASGDGWVELSTDFGEGPEPVAGLPVGLREITFWRPTRRYGVVSNTDTQVVLYAFNEGGQEPGWAGWPILNNVAATVKGDGQTIYGDWSSIFKATPGDEATDTLEFDFYFPGGLAHINNNGGLEARSVQIEYQYRDVDLGGPFTSVRKTYVEATLDQIGFTERVDIPMMRPEARARRVGAASTSTQDRDTVQWSGLKSRLGTRTSYPDWTTLAVELRSGGRIAARSENKFNVIQTRILPVLQPNGTWGNPQPTRDIAAFVRYIAQTIGYTDDQLDVDAFLELNPIWKARGENFDFIYDETVVANAIKLALAAGMSEMTINDGLIRPVRDDVRTVFEHPYSTQNTINGIARSFRTKRIDDPDGVEVEYIDRATWSKKVVRCFLPGDTGFKVQKMKVDGVTDRTIVWRIGMRQRRVLKYRKWQYSFDCELDALNSEYLSYVPLFDDIPGYGFATLLDAPLAAVPGGALVTVLDKLQWSPGESHIVAYRRPDGLMVGPFAATPGPDEYSLIAAMPQPWPVPSLKMELPHIFFGTSKRFCFPALITAIRPSGLESVSVDAANYHPLVYASDNETPPDDA